ncbi:MAG: hypothetical protein HRU06_11365 [Oceanospirillaceae bacterium]|nr:hypothetical protein [Oceanospirillaceae bacterium]
MPLDKKPHFVVVHGVQAGTDADIESDKQINKLLKAQLSNIERSEDYEVIGIKYEDINDSAQKPYQLLLSALTAGNPLNSLTLSRIFDVVGDVFIASKGGKTANKIRAKIKAKILASHHGGHPVYLIAHSLGTVYCLDVLCELMSEGEFYTGTTQDNWPVHCFISMGSPLGLPKIFATRDIPALRSQSSYKFCWHNFHHPLDPVVSGNVFGAPEKYSGAIGPVETLYKGITKEAKWRIEGHRTVQSSQWLFAHISYWGEPIIGDTLIDIVWG